MNKALSKLFATVLVTAMFFGFLPAAIISATEAPQRRPLNTVAAPCLFLVGSNNLGAQTFYTNTTSVGTTFTITAWINTTANEGGWVGAFTFNATQIQCDSVSFVANSSSQSDWLYDNGYYAPGTGTAPFLDSVTPPRALDNVGGSIGEPRGFGEVVIGRSVLAPTSPLVEGLISITFEFLAGAIPPAGPGNTISGKVAWDPSVAFIVNKLGTPESNVSFGNFVYAVTNPSRSRIPPPPPSSQYNVSFGQTGVGSDFTGTVVTIDGSDYSYSTLPVTFSWDNGSTHTFAFQSPLVVDSSTMPYYWASTTGLSTLQSGSITVTGDGRVVGNYATGLHDVIVTDITGPAWVYQRQAATIKVTVSNIGDFNERVKVTLYYDVNADEIIGAYPIALEVGQNYALLFAWNTTGVRCLNYTLTAVAMTATGSNSLSDGTVTVRLLGDVNGDWRVDMRDVASIARAFGFDPSSPNRNPAADVNGDGLINMKDLAIVARNFGRQLP